MTAGIADPEQPPNRPTIGCRGAGVQGEIVHWRGPAPFHFVVVPDDESAAIESVSSALTYGWGAIPVKARIGATDFSTAMFPKDERYFLPVKVAVRRAERLELGDQVQVRLTLDI